MRISAVLICALALCLAQGTGGMKTTGRLDAALRSARPGDQIGVWVFLTDKGPAAPNGLSVDLISRAALMRRARVLPADRLVDESDLPVSANYTGQIARIVTRIRQTSRWLNAVSVKATPAQISSLDSLPFVREIEVLQRYRRAPETEKSATTVSRRSPSTTGETGGLNYGSSLAQVALENIPAVHATGNSAQGIIIGVFDNGFRLLSHEAFDVLRPRILAQRDFVDHKVSVVPNDLASKFGEHGVNTLSTLAGYKPGQIIGPAYGASFILARTENDSSETPIEEDNWAAAIEWAESLGVQVTSTSLGYLTFDSGYTSLTWQDMDGKTAVITRAAVMAARKGVIVVNSAGNDADKRSDPNTLIAPADADSILTAGAVNAYGVRTAFSSYGPTADGRIKPDVMAVGKSVKVADAYVATAYALMEGTSFSCPLTAGVAALVLNAHPEATAMQVVAAIKSTARQGTLQTTRPDNFYGWGIVDAVAAINFLGSGPSVPVALDGSNVSITSFTANWTAVAGATSYRLDVALDPAFTSYATGYDYRNVGNVTHFDVTGLTSGGIHYYRVHAVGPSGTSASSNTVTVSTAPAVAADLFLLSGNYPNPFNPGTRIDFQVRQQSHISLEVFDILGRQVKTLVEGDFPTSPGTPYFVIWDGTDDSGARVGSGVYYYTMKATGVSGASERKTMKMMLVK